MNGEISAILFCSLTHYSFIYSFNKHLCSAYCLPGKVLGSKKKTRHKLSLHGIYLKKHLSYTELILENVCILICIVMVIHWQRDGDHWGNYLTNRTVKVRQDGEHGLTFSWIFCMITSFNLLRFPLLVFVFFLRVI